MITARPEPATMARCRESCREHAAPAGPALARAVIDRIDELPTASHRIWLSLLKVRAAAT
jgi:hypothetical protein